jgi:hypothetical protein
LVTLPPSPTTKILAIGRLTAKATPGAEHDPVAEDSVDYPPVPRGKDRSVVSATGRKSGFMNLNDMTEARDDLERLPLGRASLMTFELILLGPSGPLRILLSEPAKQSDDRIQESSSA